jgi:hypothetical protein
MTTRQYSSRSQQSTLTSAITAGTTSITVVSGTALLGGVTIPAGRTFTLVIDPDTALEEIVDATTVSTHTFTITRAIDGSSPQEHSAGAVVRHMAIGRDYRDANLHTQASASYNDGEGNAQSMHGIASGEGDVVGTLKAQTLTNKIITAPTISDPTITGTASAGAVLVFEGTTVDAYDTTLTVVDPTQNNTITIPNTTGIVVVDTFAQTLTNKILTSPTISGSPTITGLSSAGMVSSSATPKDYVDAILGSATSAATSAASAATSATSADASATAAATSASSASTSASSALTSANSAEVSAASAAAAVTTAIQASIIDAKGDLIVGTAADTAGRLAVGTNGYILTADSTETTGIKWSAAPAGYLAPTIGTTVINSGTTVSTIDTVTLNNATLTGTLTAGATSGTNGYLLTATTSGVTWAAAPVSLPSQTGNTGKLLTTDGTTASWDGAAPIASPTEPTTLIDGLVWVDTDGSVVGQQMVRWSKAPTGGTTSLSGTDDGSTTLSYTVGYEQVYRNGVLLSRGNDYTATDGTSITLTDATITGDIIEVFASAVLAIADVYTQAQSDSKYATLTTAQTLTNKTLTAPIITDAIVKGINEDVNVVASAATGTIDFDVDTASIWYYTSDATANFTLNFRFSSGVSLDTALATGDAITLVFLNTNGATPYYPDVIEIDGSAVTPKVPAAISAGNASAIDAYSFTIIKTASATFTVLETQTKFA